MPLLIDSFTLAAFSRDSILLPICLYSLILSMAEAWLAVAIARITEEFSGVYFVSAAVDAIKPATREAVYFIKCNNYYKFYG